MSVSDEGRPPERYSGAYFTANAFRLLGERPILGRDFLDVLPGDDKPGAEALVRLARRVRLARAPGDRSRSDQRAAARMIQ